MRSNSLRIRFRVKYEPDFSVYKGYSVMRMLRWKSYRKENSESIPDPVVLLAY